MQMTPPPWEGGGGTQYAESWSSLHPLAVDFGSIYIYLFQLVTTTEGFKFYIFLMQITPPPWGEGRGYSSRSWVGVLRPGCQTLTLFMIMTNISHFPYPVYDMNWKKDELWVLIWAFDFWICWGGRTATGPAENVGENISW